MAKAASEAAALSYTQMTLWHMYKKSEVCSTTAQSYFPFPQPPSVILEDAFEEIILIHKAVF